MREGPLAELFRATEAAQRAAAGEEIPASPVVDDPQPALPAQPELREEPPAPTPLPTRQPEAEVAPAPTPALAPAPAPVAIPEPAPEPERPAARWLEPLPANPARLERARE